MGYQYSTVTLYNLRSGMTDHDPDGSVLITPGVSLTPICTATKIRCEVYGERTEITLNPKAHGANPNQALDHCDYVKVEPKVDDNGNLNEVIPFLMYRVLDVKEGPQRSVLNASGSKLSDADSITYVLQLDPLTTISMVEYYASANNKHTNILARWSRLPMQAVIEPFQIRPAQMMRGTPQKLTRNISDFYNNYGLFKNVVWVQMTYINSQGNFYTTGIFAATDNIDLKDKAGGTSQDPAHSYPALKKIINNPDTYMGAPTASAIISLSISVRCPYECGIEQIRAGEFELPRLKNRSAQLISPSSVVVDEGYNQYVVYNQTQMQGCDIDTMSGYITVTADEAVLGSVKLYDVCNTLVGSVDTRYAEDDNGTLKINYTMQTMSNMNTMYTRMVFKDGSEIRFPEGTLPYNGSAYQEYAIAQMKYDRELLAMNQERVMVNAVTGLAGSVANGAIASIASAGAGAGTAAVGIGGNILDAYMTYQQNERTQKAKEQLMRNTPDTLYNSVYGLDYPMRWFDTVMPGYAVIEMPAGVTSSELSDYVKTHGYPVSDIPLTVTHPQLITAGDGFLQANMVQKFTVDMTPTPQKLIYYMNNHWFLGKLAKQLKAGVHYIVKTS